MDISTIIRIASRHLYHTKTIINGLQRRMRNFYFRHLLHEMGNHCQICNHTTLVDPSNISLGNHVMINQYVILQAYTGATILIGNRVCLSFGAMVLTGGLDVDDLKSHSHKVGSIIIEDEVWIGAGAIILPGVRLGAGSVVAAGSVVTKDVPPRTMVAGIPAKILRYLNVNDNDES